MIAVDTNIISSWLRGKTSLPNSEIFVPFVVLAELKCWLGTGNVQKHQKQLDELFTDDNLTLSPSLMPAAIDCYVQIYAYLRTQGTPISPNDMWIAAECMSLSLPFLTHDLDFKNVPQIILV